MVGAAARIETTVSQLANLARRCLIASVGDNPFLACTVDALIHIAEVELGGIAYTYQARAGEEIAIYGDGYFSLSDSTQKAVFLLFVRVKVRENFVLKVAE